jgi:hypothetical protein
LIVVVVVVINYNFTGVILGLPLKGTKMTAFVDKVLRRAFGPKGKDVP